MPVERYTDDDGHDHIVIEGSHTTVDIEEDDDGHNSVTVTHDYD